MFAVAGVVIVVDASAMWMMCVYCVLQEAQLISMQRSGPSTGTPALTPSKAKDDEIAHLRTALEEANARIVELEKEASAMTSQAVTDTLHARIAALTSEVESKAKEAAKACAGVIAAVCLHSPLMLRVMACR